MKIHQPVFVSNKAGGSISPAHVPKDWGYELIYHNGEDFCMKALVIKPHKTVRRHLHLVKSEVFYVSAGEVLLQYEDGNRNKFQQWLPKGAGFEVPPGMPHSMTAGELQVILIEASTQHFDHDSIRI